MFTCGSAGWDGRRFVHLRTAGVPRAGTEPGSQIFAQVVIMDTVLSHIVAAALTLVVATGPQQPPPGAPDVPQQGQARQAPEGPVELPVSLDRIQRALSRPPAIQPRSDRPVFRVEVFAPKPTVEDILGPDYLIGPVPYGGMTHSEFLNMVTPSEYRGYSMFTNKEGMTIAATSLALQWALMKAVDKLKSARDERAKEAARREVMEAMNQLEEANRKAKKNQ
jgi:hypothetical protein